VPGVRGTDPGSMTAAGDGERLEGVVCVAFLCGYDVSLQLVGELVALQPVGARVRAAVIAAAGGLGVPLARVTVHFAELAVAAR